MKFFALEGNTQKLDGGAMYGNAPKAMWSKWSPEDAQNRIDLACRCLLVQWNGKNILFEAGVGAFFEPKLKDRFGIVETEHVLLNSLRQVGLTDADIDFVVLSHLHFDHAGGILSAYEMNKAPQLLFPKALFFVGESHWQRANQAHPRDKASFVPVMNDLLKNSGRLRLVEKNDVPTEIRGLVEFTFSDGHTPGLMISKILAANGPVIFGSDMIPGAPWVHVPISMGYDRFPELLVDEKRQLLESVIHKNAKLFFTHDPKMKCGLLQQDAMGKFFVQEYTL